MQARKTQVYLFDDDVHPLDRATKVKGKLEGRGVKVELFRTFTGLKDAFREGRINKDGLFVMDSTIVEKGKTFTFGETLPWITGAGGINPRNLMPASGGRNGFLNNDFFKTWLEISKNYVCTLEQTGLAVTGMGGDPESVARRITEYYETLRPGIGEGRGPGWLR